MTNREPAPIANRAGTWCRGRVRLVALCVVVCALGFVSSRAEAVPLPAAGSATAPGASLDGRQQHPAALRTARVDDEDGDVSAQDDGASEAATGGTSLIAPLSVASPLHVVRSAHSRLIFHSSPSLRGPPSLHF